jgi:hypothetical protein
VKGSRKGCKKGIGKGSKTRGLCHDYIIVNLYTCMRGARYVCLIPWTLQSGSEQFIYNWKLEEQPGPGSRKLEAAQRTGQEEIRTEIYRERYIRRAEAARKQKSC